MGARSTGRIGADGGTAGTRQRGPSHLSASEGAELERAVWERVMRRLRVSTRLLSAVLLALVARAIGSGLGFAVELSATIVAFLLLVALLLTRQGRRLEPRVPEDT